MNIDFFNVEDYDHESNRIYNRLLNYIKENFNLYNASNIEEMENYLKTKLSKKEEFKEIMSNYLDKVL